MAIDTIGTNAITNDAVNAAKIAAGAVDADITAIPDDSVTTAKIAAGAVGNTEVASGISASKLTAGNLPSAQMPSGSVIQCVTDTRTVGNTGSGADITDLTISVVGGYSSATQIQSLNITPLFSNSKILVQWSGQMRMNSSGAGGIQMFFGKDSSNLMTSGGNADAAIFMYNQATMQSYYQAQAAQFSFIAGQTTQMTLDVRMSSYNSNAPILLSHDGLECLTAWEIAQ